MFTIRLSDVRRPERKRKRRRRNGTLRTRGTRSDEGQPVCDRERRARTARRRVRPVLRHASGARMSLLRGARVRFRDESTERPEFDFLCIDRYFILAERK